MDEIKRHIDDMERYVKELERRVDALEMRLANMTDEAERQRRRAEQAEEARAIFKTSNECLAWTLGESRVKERTMRHHALYLDSLLVDLHLKDVQRALGDGGAA